MFLLDRLLYRMVQVGRLEVIDAEGERHIYQGSAGPDVAVRLKDKSLYRRLFLHPELVAGEAYMDETLTIERGTLRDMLTLFFLNARKIRSHPVQKVLNTALKRIKKLHQKNNEKVSRANVQHHYDLSNELYRQFLDKDMNYSCAYFEEGDDLETAQQRKLRHIAAKLNLKPGQSVLDIGCGWGGMALYMAEAAEVEVLGITLSTEQLELARQRARERGLDNRVRFELMDYRKVEGEFDRVVSIGMFEHVGVVNYDTFFAKVAELLKPDGVALLHSIGRRGKPSSTSAWIRKYIFPGGYSPSLSEVFPAVERSGLWVTDLEILRLHYAKTLHAWHDRFLANRAKIAKLLDERFCRMWEFYLIGSELTFVYSGHMVWQMQMAKMKDTLPLTRDYLAAAESELPLAATRH
jgi:cyclopropane-fatty-acyl-phospholipid synthase